MLQGIESGNSDNASINILPDLIVVMTFSLCYNKLDQSERTSSPAEKANSSLIHFGREDLLNFGLTFGKADIRHRTSKEFRRLLWNYFLRRVK